MALSLPELIRHRAARQDDVLTLAQLRSLGVSPGHVGRRVDAGDWQRLHRGVLVVHSGPISWRSRARGALLHAGTDAVLSHRSAGYVLEYLHRPPSIIEVCVPEHRRVRRTAGVRVRRRRRLDAEWVGRFPMTTRGATLVDLVTQAQTTDDAIGLVCAAVRARTRPEEILDAAAGRRALPRRDLLLELLVAADDGIESALELRYHRDVEARHGLPTAHRQGWERIDDRWIRADVRYVGLGVRVELDGRLAHPGGRTDSDTWRDNAVLLAHDEITLRYRWVHVALSSCETAAQVVRALRSRGWDGPVQACSPHCPVR